MVLIQSGERLIQLEFLIEIMSSLGRKCGSRLGKIIQLG
jgi:hypothetical protein